MSEEKREFDTYWEDVKTFPEELVFFSIDSLSGFAWRLEHDAADGRIPNDESIDRGLAALRAKVDAAVDQLARFGIKARISGEEHYELNIRGHPLLEKFCPRDSCIGKKFPSPEYWAWYRRWAEWKNGLSQEKWDRLNTKLSRGESIEEFNPPYTKQEGN